jgi:hypothetical protein
MAFAVMAMGHANNNNSGSSGSSRSTSTPRYGSSGDYLPKVEVPITYTYLQALEEKDTLLQEATLADFRKQIAETLLVASETVRAFVDNYVRHESLAYKVELHARVSKAGKFGEWGDANAVDFNTLEHSVNIKYDSSFVQTIPKLECKIAIKSNDSTAQLFAIYVRIGMAFVDTQNRTLARQITISSTYVADDDFIFTLFGKNTAPSFADLNPLAIHDSDLLWICDVNMIKTLCRRVVAINNKREIIIHISVHRPAFVSLSGSSSEFNTNTVMGHLRQSLDAPFFFDAAEIEENTPTAIRKFESLSAFITWANDSRIKGHDDKAINLTRKYPHVITLATLLRVLDTIDDFSFTPQN